MNPTLKTWITLIVSVIFMVMLSYYASENYEDADWFMFASDLVGLFGMASIARSAWSKV